MIVYHVTSATHALVIDAQGFRDDGEQLSCLGPETTGFWVCDRPVLDLSPFNDPVAYELEIADEALAGCEIVEEGRSYREWLVGATVLNAARRRRTEIFDDEPSR